MRIIVILIVLLFSANVWAQDSSVSHTPPMSEQGKKFKSTAKNNYQQTDVRYVDPSKKLGEVDKPKKAEKKLEARKLSGAEIASRNRTMKYIAIAILGGIVLIAFFMWLDNRTGGKLFGWLKPKDRFVDSDSKNMAGNLADAADNPHLSNAALSNITDPETGMHNLLVQALIRAAQQNNIPLRRSLTSRDILRRVPKDWPHREILHALINRTELVLFGGRSISLEEYQQSLALANPLLTGKRRR